MLKGTSVDIEKIKNWWSLCSNINFESSFNHDRNQKGEISIGENSKALSPLYNGFWISSFECQSNLTPNITNKPNDELISG